MCKLQPRINHRAPIRMETTIRIRVLHKAVAKFIHIARLFVIFLLTLFEVVMIDEVIARVVRRIDVNHLHLTQIRLLQQLQCVKIVALDVNVPRALPLHTPLRHGAQRLADGCRGLTTGGLLAHPCELVGFRLVLDGIIAKELAQLLEVYNMPQSPLATLVGGVEASVKHDGATL